LGWRDAAVSRYLWIKEHVKSRRARQNSSASDSSSQTTSLGALSEKNFEGVQLHPVALVTDFNPKASKSGL
jgi:hypothetical protein